MRWKVAKQAEAARVNEDEKIGLAFLLELDTALKSLGLDTEDPKVIQTGGGIYKAAQMTMLAEIQAMVKQEGNAGEEIGKAFGQEIDTALKSLGLDTEDPKVKEAAFRIFGAAQTMTLAEIKAVAKQRQK